VPRHVVSIYEGLQKEAKAQGFELAYSEGVRMTEGRVWGGRDRSPAGSQRA
jgi:beta-glucosidase